MSFINQALEGVSQHHNVELLEKYAKVTKEDVLQALKTYFLPLFDSTSSVAVVVTAPAKAASTSEELTKLGFDVEQRSVNIDPDEDGEFSDSESESDRDNMSTDSR